MFAQVLLGARPVQEKSEEMSSLIRAVEGEKGHELNILTAHRVLTGPSNEAWCDGRPFFPCLSQSSSLSFQDAGWGLSSSCYLCHLQGHSSCAESYRASKSLVPECLIEFFA